MKEGGRREAIRGLHPLCGLMRSPLYGVWRRVVPGALRVGRTIQPEDVMSYLAMGLTGEADLRDKRVCLR